MEQSFYKIINNDNNHYKKCTNNGNFTFINIKKT